MSWTNIRCALGGALATVVVICVTSFLILPMYGYYTERARVSSMLSGLRRVMDLIELQAKRQGTLEGSGSSLAEAAVANVVEFAGMVRVLDNGMILARTSEVGSFIVLEPLLINGVVTWKCVGGPMEDMPLQCRGK